MKSFSSRFIALCGLTVLAAAMLGADGCRGYLSACLYRLWKWCDSQMHRGTRRRQVRLQRRLHERRYLPKNLIAVTVRFL
jgi:hypothetical protein